MVWGKTTKFLQIDLLQKISYLKVPNKTAAFELNWLFIYQYKKLLLNSLTSKIGTNFEESATTFASLNNKSNKRLCKKKMEFLKKVTDQIK